MNRFAKLEDPKVLTQILTVLAAAMLWIALWSAMSGMGGMADMSADRGGMAAMAPDEGGMAAMGDGTGAGGDMTGGLAETPPMRMGDEAGGESGMGEDMGDGAMPGMSAAMDMPGMSMDPTDWSASTIGATIAMWVLMMAAMMLPSMAPVMSIYAGVSAKEDRGARLAARITLFAVSYLLVWTIFSVFAALGQLALRSSPHFAMGGTLALPLAGGALMIVAGLWQFTPVKDVCLRHCRHPLQYLLSHWRPGLAGAFPVGFRHGLYCFGCCVALMGLMFVLGAMTLWWMAVIAVYFVAEKVLPGAERWGRVAGALMIVSGAVLIIWNI